jgi:glutathione S-transferase
LNPHRKVPVLIDDDVVVYDSTQIAEYLEDRYPQPPLFPASIAERVRCRRQEAAADEIWFPLVWDLIDTRFYPSDGAADARATAADDGLKRLYEKLERDLEGRDFYCDGFSVADIGTAVFVFAASTLGAPPPDALANVKAWMDRIQLRPAVAAVMADLTEAAASAMAA